MTEVAALVRPQQTGASRTLVAAAHDAFKRGDKGQILATDLDNIRLALILCDARMTFNEFARTVCLNGSRLEDIDVETLWVRIIDEYHFRPSRETLRTVLNTEAHAHPVHPVRKYLDSLRWDGTARLDGWLTTYAGAQDSAYVQAVAALPLIAAVRRVRRPGAKFDELLILESAQGTLKSSALRALCHDEAWFTDGLQLGMEPKQVIEHTEGKWIVEAAELHGNRGREAEALKAFLSREVDGPVRLAYGRYPTTVPRQFVMIGTTNTRTGYLKDMTGARRFWPVRVTGFNLDALVRDRNQLWAEAAAREAAGTSIRLPESLWAAAAAQQDERRAEDPWESILEPLLVGDGLVEVRRVAVADIWQALGLAANQLDNRHAGRVDAIAQRCGFTVKRRVRVNGQPTLCWVREEPQ